LVQARLGNGVGGRHCVGSNGIMHRVAGSRDFL
jgi:hypothetical protein